MLCAMKILKNIIRIVEVNVYFPKFCTIYNVYISMA